MSGYRKTQKSTLLSFAGFLIINSLCIKLLFAQEPTQEEIAKLRNPFESWFNISKREEESGLKRNKPLDMPAQTIFNLTGIMKGKRNLAIINGEIVAEGDIIEGEKVILIGKETVILGEGNKKITLEIKDEF